jgi:hypothetical protein
VSAPVLCTVGVVIMFYIESHWIHQNTWNTFVCCLFSGCGINAFRMASSNSSPAEKSCACAYIAFLAGIFSWYADSRSVCQLLRQEKCVARPAVSDPALQPRGKKHGDRGEAIWKNDRANQQAWCGQLLSALNIFDFNHLVFRSSLSWLELSV